MNYKEITFTVTPYSEDIADVIIAELGNIGYDGFSYTDNGFTTYIPDNHFNEKAIAELDILSFLSPNFKIRWTCSNIQNQNWNKTWEDNFTPIIIKDRILIRAGFHPGIENIEYEIIIEPEMSFGTGHHSTTALMLETILDYTAQIKGKRILDMGCGTGILSIMAAKTGATDVTGIDIDEWAYNNAQKNIDNNHIHHISVKIGDVSLLQQENNFDVILANINRNILLRDMQQYVNKLNTDGYLFISGFYTEDLSLLQQEAERLNLEYLNHKTDHNWVAAVFYKKQPCC